MFFECDNFESCFEKYGECPSDLCHYFRACEHCTHYFECVKREDYDPDVCPIDREILIF